MSCFKKTCFLCHSFYILKKHTCFFMGVDKPVQPQWWPLELQPFAFYLTTLNDPLDQEKAQKRVQHIVADHNGDIGKAVQFLTQDMARSQHWDRTYSPFYSNGKTYLDPLTGRWKQYSPQPTQQEQSSQPQKPDNPYRVEPTIY